MSTTRLFDPDTKVIDHAYVIFTTRYGIDADTGSKLDASRKATVMYINAEPTLEVATISIDKTPVQVLLPCVLLRDNEQGGDARHLIRVIYDKAFVAQAGDTATLVALIAEATRRPNTYNPLYRQ
jgi:hypothetical protein